jgi:radical SAM-linked protein
MRIRISFGKNEQMRFTGHLDLHRAWERTFRRARLPIAYSQGFHPQPRINLAAALPLGFTSSGEVGDIWLEEWVEIEKIKGDLTKALPPGIEIYEIKEVEPSLPSLQSQVIAAEYQVTLLDSNSHLDNDLSALLQSESIPRERRGRLYDLRPLIEDLQRLPDDENCRPRLLMRLAAQEGATGRPEEVLSAMKIPNQASLVHRTRLIFRER